MAIWYNLRPIGNFYGQLVTFMAILVNFVVLLVYFSRFGTLYQEKSGNPDNIDYRQRLGGGK
jgi:hypothetical protein